MDFLEDNYLYIATNGIVSAIDPDDGKVLWKTNLSSKAGMTSFHSHTINILYRDGLVYAAVYGHLFCLDAVNGEMLWHNGLTGFGYHSISMAMEGINTSTRSRPPHGV